MHPHTIFLLPLRKNSSQDEGLLAFELDLYELILSIKFDGRASSFQKQLSTNIKAIRRSEKLLIHADKTTNMYKISAPDYNRLLNDNVTVYSSLTLKKRKQA